MHTRDTETSSERDETPALSVQNLVKTYGDGPDGVTAVDGVSLEIDSGSIVGLLGENGAGKTTLIKCIFGIISPDSGEIEVVGEPIGRHPRKVYSHAAAVLEGARNTYWRLTVEENLEFFARLAGYPPEEQHAYHEELLEKLNIADKRETVVNELSRGMKQKVSLATILARRPEVLFLDEPTLGLDVESSLDLRTEIERLVAEREMTVVVSSHDMDVIEEICDRVVILSGGEVIADDTVENLLSSFEGNQLVVELRDVPSDLRDRLAADHAVDEWTHRQDQVRARFTVEDAEEIHSLVGTVVRTDARVSNLRTEQTDFEDVFLEVTSDTSTTRPTPE
jgi:ABC-2 type transport system ATP-binding protein